MSDTPKTDAAAFLSNDARGVECVRADFARAQERWIVECLTVMRAAQEALRNIRKDFFEHSDISGRSQREGESALHALDASIQKATQP